MKKLFLPLLLFSTAFYAQLTTIANYNFNASTAYPVLPSATASNVISSGSSSDTFTVLPGTASGSGAFSTNSTAGNALAIANSSGANTRYFLFQLSGADLSLYQAYKLYFQPQRSSAGASLITVAYSTNGSTYTNFASTYPVTTAFTDVVVDLSAVTALNNLSTVYIKLLLSGATATTGTLRIDNFEVQANKTGSGGGSGGGASGPWTVSGGNLNFTGNVGIGNAAPAVPLDVNGNTNINGNLTTMPTKNIVAGGNLIGNSNLAVAGTANLNGDVVVAPTKSLIVDGFIVCNGTLKVGGTSTFGGDIVTAANKTLTVAGRANFNGDVATAAGKTVTVGGSLIDNGNLTVVGTTSLNGNVTTAANKTLTVAGRANFNGDVVTAAGKTVTVGGSLIDNGSLTVVGTTSLNGNIFTAANKTLTIGGTAKFNNNVNLGGKLLFGNSGSKFGIGFTPAVPNGPSVFKIGVDSSLFANSTPLTWSPCTLIGAIPPVVTTFGGLIQTYNVNASNNYVAGTTIFDIGANASEAYLNSKFAPLSINRDCGSDIYLLGVRVGFGTSAPTEKFHFTNGNVLIDGNASSGNNYRVKIDGGVQPGLQVTTTHVDAFSIADATTSQVNFKVNKSGETQINTTSTGDAFSIADASTSQINFKINKSGVTQIGSTSGIAAFLNVKGDLNTTSANFETNHNVDYGYNTTINVNRNLTKAFAIQNTANNPLGNESLVIYGNGYTEIKVYSPLTMPKPYGALNARVFTIRDMTGSQDLFVVTAQGKVYAREVEINTTANFPDYVFEKNYKLKPLNEVDAYINKNKHLPNFEKGDYYQKNGLNVTDLLLKQQQTIEELMLYTIELEKKSVEAEKQNAEILKRLQALEAKK